MDSRIGQLRKNDQLTPVTIVSGNNYPCKFYIIPDSQEYSIICQCITGLEKGKTYFTKIQIKRMNKVEDYSPYLQGDDNDLSFDIYLGHCTIETNNETSQSTITSVEQIQLLKKSIMIVGHQEEEDSLSEYGNINLVYTVNNDQINCVYIKLKQKACDYAHSSKDENPRIEWLIQDGNFSYNLYKVNNILGLQSGQVAIKIGVQSRPGQMIVINKEPIRIGRSGVYEINNGLQVNYFSIIPDNNNIIPNFIVDYVATSKNTTNVSINNTSQEG